MNNLIAQAENAAQHQQWFTVVSLLQEVLIQPLSSFDSTQTTHLLALALQVLELGDFQERWDVAKLLPTFGEAAIAPLIQRLRNEEIDLESRWFAARILGELNHPDAIRALVNQIQNSDDADLSKVAAEALAHLGSPAIKALTELLHDEDSRSFAIQALAQIHQPETIPPLLSVVEDPNPNIRAMVIDTLTAFQDARIPPVLLKAVKDSSAVVRRAAIAGLGLRSQQAEHLDFIHLLCEALWDVNLSVSRQAVLSLGRLQQNAAVPHLTRALEAPTSSVSLQVDVVRALGWIGTESALHCLREILLQEEKSYPVAVCEEVVTTLGLWSTPSLCPQAAQILVEWLNSPSSLVQSLKLRQAIATALGQLKQPLALDALIQLLAEPDPSVQLHAIAALKAFDPEIALTRLHEIKQQAPSPPLEAGINLALREWQIELPQ